MEESKTSKRVGVRYIKYIYIHCCVCVLSFFIGYISMTCHISNIIFFI